MSLHSARSHLVYAFVTYGIHKFPSIHPSQPFSKPPSQPPSSSGLRRLVNLLVREPLARLEILLLERRIQNAQSTYLARGGGVVALDVCFGFAVGGL